MKCFFIVVVIIRFF